MNDRKVLLLRFPPLTLQTELCLNILCENEYPRRLSVQPVNDEDSVTGLAVTFANVISQNKVSCSCLVRIRADRQKARRFIDHENVSVLVKDHDASRQAPFANRNHDSTLYQLFEVLSQTAWPAA
jgi:hypothetical protein